MNNMGDYGGGGGKSMDRMSSMLAEQKRINEELMANMRQMQNQMKEMRNMGPGPESKSGSGAGGGGYSTGAGGGGYSTGAGEGGYSSGAGGSGYSTGMANSSANDYWGSSGMSGLGSGYGSGYGGGKVAPAWGGMGGMGGFGGMAGGRHMPYNMRVPKQPGDWDCPQCGNMNFAKRQVCNGPGGCSVERRPEFVRRGMETEEGGGPKNRRPGDWDCYKCGNMNYARRTECNTEDCNVTRQEAAQMGGFMGGGMMGGMMQMPYPGVNKGGPMFPSAGDWECPKCQNLNYARREQCNRKDCDFEKKDLDDYGSQMGAGGVFGADASGSYKTAPKPGDWDCPRCGNMNFANRDICNGKMDGEPCLLRKPEFDKYGVPEIRSKDVRRPGDWDCFRCGNINFKIRSECNKCGLNIDDATSYSFREMDGGSE